MGGEQAVDGPGKQKEKTNQLNRTFIISTQCMSYLLGGISWIILVYLLSEGGDYISIDLKQIVPLYEL